MSLVLSVLVAVSALKFVITWWHVYCVIPVLRENEDGQRVRVKSIASLHANSQGKFSQQSMSIAHYKLLLALYLLFLSIKIV